MQWPRGCQEAEDVTCVTAGGRMQVREVHVVPSALRRAVYDGEAGPPLTQVPIFILFDAYDVRYGGRPVCKG